MPVIKSAIKKMRQDVKRRQHNRLKKGNLKELLNRAQKNPTGKNISAAISFTDKLSKTNLIHKNKAARIKSRLSKLLGKTKPKSEPKKSSSKKKV